MKPLLIKENTRSDASFMLKRKEFKFFPVKFHYHSELELVLKAESSGEMIVGNYAGRFNSGELYLLGENLPHYWKNDEEYYQDNELKAVSIVAHFDYNFAGAGFMKIPEMQAVASLLEKSKRGALFGKGITLQAICRLESMLELSGFERFMAFMALLELLATSQDYTLLSTEGFVQGSSLLQSEPLKKVYEYVMTNFKSDISQTDAASKVGMNVSAFSRFFHKSTKKTFTQFVNEVRLGYACRMIMEGEYNISQIAYECGYNNLSNFNTQFKNVFKQTPSEYKANLLRMK